MSSKLPESLYVLEVVPNRVGIGYRRSVELS